LKDRVGVIGLGYIGLPLLAALAESGYGVVGMDIDTNKIVSLQKTHTADIHEPGLSPALDCHADEIEYTTNTKYLMDTCSTILVTVGTPLGERDIPDINSIYNVVSEIVKYLRKGHLIILKSTVYPGLTRQVAQELEVASGLKAGRDFFVAFHPERTIEGAAIKELHTLPKIIGGINKASTDKAAAIVEKLGGEVMKVSCPEVAELCKLIDNTFRVNNIAFANEIGDICRSFGVDPYEVQSVVNDSYGRTNLFTPGLGADGPCLSKDPQILAYYANSKSVETRVIDASVRKGSDATLRVARVTSRFLLAKQIREPVIAIAGLAFKGVPETDDTRDSPAVKIQWALSRTMNKIVFRYYDPLVKQFLGSTVYASLVECVRGANVIMLLTNHHRLMNIDMDILTKQSGRPLLIIDCWHNARNPDRQLDTDTEYYRLGG